MKICRARPQLVFTFDNRFSSPGCAVQQSVCLVHNFLPPSELLVCYQPHRQEVMPGQKSIYETFLVHAFRRAEYDRKAFLNKRDNAVPSPGPIPPCVTYSILSKYIVMEKVGTG